MPFPPPDPTVSGSVSVTVKGAIRGANVMVKVGGVWKYAIVYVKAAGVWKELP
jgi:hypothetical protein